jgi:hypothetical protein
MLISNYKILGLSKEQGDAMIASLQKGNLKTIGEIKAVIRANASKYMDLNKGVADFRPLGIGVLFWTKEGMGDYGNYAKLEYMVQHLMEWDAVCIAHGSSNKDSAKIAKLQSERNEVLKQEKNNPGNHGSKRSSASIEKEINDLEREWTMQALNTTNAGPFTKMNDFVRQIKREGFKRLLILSCNPGGHRLPDDIVKDRGFLVRYASLPVFV